MPRGGGTPNAGLLGATARSSFGKCKVTSKTSSGNVTLQPGTRVVETLVVGGGGGGGANRGGGGGAGGFRQVEANAQGTVPVTVGGGGSGGSSSSGPATIGTAGQDSVFGSS